MVRLQTNEGWASTADRPMRAFVRGATPVQTNEGWGEYITVFRRREHLCVVRLQTNEGWGEYITVFRRREHLCVVRLQTNEGWGEYITVFRRREHLCVVRLQTNEGWGEYITVFRRMGTFVRSATSDQWGVGRVQQFDQWAHLCEVRLQTNESSLGKYSNSTNENICAWYDFRPMSGGDTAVRPMRAFVRGATSDQWGWARTAIRPMRAFVRGATSDQWGWASIAFRPMTCPWCDFRPMRVGASTAIRPMRTFVRVRLQTNERVLSEYSNSTNESICAWCEVRLLINEGWASTADRPMRGL